MKNKLKFYRLQLAAREGRDISQIEFAELLGVSRWSLNRWEKQVVQPDLQTLYKVWVKLKAYFPGLNMQDLLE